MSPPKLLRACTLVATAIFSITACRGGTLAASRERFFFIQMSDPQFGMFTANEDFSRETVHFERAIAAANRLRPAFVVVNGDLTNRQGDAAQIAEYHRIIAKLDRSIPLYSVAGNHDLALPLSPASVAAYRVAYGRDRYTFRRGDVFGIVINSSLVKEAASAPGETAAQDAWLAAALDTAHTSGAAHVMVFQHHPWFLADAAEPDQYFNLPLATRRRYLDLLQRAGVRHDFAGHYHRNALGMDGAFEMITTGPVGKPLGVDPSGIRLVFVDGSRVTHRYVALDSIPDTVR